MSQLKRHSAVEVVASTLFGYVVAVIAYHLVFPIYGIKVTVMQNLEIAAIFTILSIVRSYIFRRIFNSFT